MDPSPLNVDTVAPLAAGLPMEGILVAAVLALVLLPPVVHLLRRRRRLGMVALLVWMLAPTTVLVLDGRLPRPLPESAVIERPIEVREGGYVSSKACAACHPREYATWRGSYHRTMTQVATPEAVVGRFDGKDNTFFGFTYRMKRKGDEFWIDRRSSREERAQDAPERVESKVVMTTGLHHMQVYWYATGSGRSLGLSPVVYLQEDQMWVPEQSTYLQPPIQGMKLALGGWNENCHQCHTTGGQPRMLSEELTDWDTKIGEFGIACEACHGPGEEHVRLNSDPRRRYEHHLADGSDPSTVNPRKLSSRLSSQVCGQCHGIYAHPTTADHDRWKVEGHTYRPGDDLDLTRHTTDGAAPPLTRTAKENPNFIKDRFWSDGMVRVAGREYNGLVKSPCYEHGDEERGMMSCLSCHQMHAHSSDKRPLSEWADDQLKPDMRTNEACFQCHESFRDDLAAHTNHAVGSSGSLCYNCHMPYTTYGLLKAIRSHTVETPSVAASVETGRPNACNQCHLNRTLEWSAEHLSSWYGIESPDLSEEQRSVAASVLWALKGDAGQRALMAWSFGWKPAREVSGENWLPIYLIQLLYDPYDAVRYIASRSLRSLPGYGDLDYHYVDRSTWPESIGKAQALWQRRHQKNPPRDPAVLFDADGKGLLFELFDAMLKQRDNRRVALAE